MLWEAYQHGKIHQAQRLAERAQMKTERHDQAIQDAVRSCERLTLACQAMWELIRDQTSLTDEDLQKKMLEVDLRDGRSDGKISKQVVVCPACGRNSSSTWSTCMICGAETPKRHLLE